MNRIIKTLILIHFSVIVFTAFSKPVNAIDTSHLKDVSNIYSDDSGNTDVLLGGGAALLPKDSARGGYKFSPVPIISITRKADPFTFFTILPYAGITVYPCPAPIQITEQIGIGEQFKKTTAHDNRVRSKAHGLFETETELKYDTGFWNFGTNVRYSPMRVHSPNRSDTYHAVIFEAFYERIMPVTMRSTVLARISLDYMNNGYANTAYSLRDDSGKIVYRAKRGFRKTSLFLLLNTGLSENVSLLSFIEESVFIGEAERSEATHDRFQTILSLDCIYRINF